MVKAAEKPRIENSAEPSNIKNTKVLNKVCYLYN